MDLLYYSNCEVHVINSFDLSNITYEMLLNYSTMQIGLFNFLRGTYRVRRMLLKQTQY